MRIAVSNIAWTASEDDEVERLLRSESVDALEAAPTRLFPSGPPSDADLARVAERLAAADLQLIAFQSLHFATPEAALFGSDAGRWTFEQQIASTISLAARLRVGVLVLGSPRNRRLAPGMTSLEAERVAVPVLRRLARAAAGAGAALCIEPNPTAYGCDWITTPAEGADLVDRVGEEGFGLHLDTAGAVLSEVDPAQAVDDFGDLIRHVHVSAPGLAEIDPDSVPHEAVGRALRARGYTGATSIEMRADGQGPNAERVRRAIRIAAAAYHD